MADAHLSSAPRVPQYPAPDPSVLFAPAPALDHTHAQGKQERTADVVIVGSGPGGGAAAQVLAEAGLKVIVLEQGPATSRFRPNQDQTARYHMQEGGTLVAEGKTLFPIAAGRGVGGGTLINSALSFRTPDAVLAEWEEVLRDDGWGIDSVGAALDEVSKIVGVCITPEEVAGENNKLIARGIAKLGFEGGLAPRSTPGCRGCGICNYGCPTMGKASANLTFLPRAVNAGAVIQADTDVVSVLVEDGRAVGVRGIVRHPDTRAPVGELTVRAPRVLLSAGAIGTPRLLWHAGLAETVSGATGKGLHIHPGGAVLGICDETIELWKGATQGAYCHVPGLPGVLPHTHGSLRWSSRRPGLLVRASKTASLCCPTSADSSCSCRTREPERFAPIPTAEQRSPTTLPMATSSAQSKDWSHRHGSSRREAPAGSWARFTGLGSTTPWSRWSARSTRAWSRTS